MKPLSFTTGMPTAPDVDRLNKHFGTPKVGTVMNYDVIGDVIGAKHKSGRYHSVVQAWRKQLYREQGVFLRCEPTVGYTAASGTERVHISGTGYKHSLTKMYRAGDLAAKTDRAGLSPDDTRSCDHIVRTTATLRLAAVTAAKQMRLPNAGNGK